MSPEIEDHVKTLIAIGLLVSIQTEDDVCEQPRYRVMFKLESQLRHKLNVSSPVYLVGYSNYNDNHYKARVTIWFDGVITLDSPCETTRKKLRRMGRSPSAV